MHRRFYSLIFLAGLFFCPASISTAQTGQIRELTDLKLLARVGQSALYQSGTVRVLLLQGTPYQIGYAHGKLASREVKQTVNRVFDLTRKANPRFQGVPDPSTLEEIYRRTLPFVPAKFREELRGLAEGAGLDYHKVELANLFPEMFHCSGFVLMGKATKDKKLIHGRILDFMTTAGLQDRAMVMVVKSPGANAIMSGSYFGFVGCITGMNDHHLSIGQMGMMGFGQWDGMPMSYMLRAALEENNRLKDVKEFLIHTHRTCRHMFLVADGKEYENNSKAFGMYSQWNSYAFLEPGQGHLLLPFPLPDCILISLGERYISLVKRVQAAYGRIDVQTAIEISKRPVAMTCNLHNAIMIPEDLVMYLSDAADPSRPNFLACDQPYYKHDFNKYLALMADLAKKTNPTSQP
jgi:isopenicillin-N N-acyltransferase like protein